MNERTKLLLDSLPEEWRELCVKNQKHFSTISRLRGDLACVDFQIFVQRVYNLLVEKPEEKFAGRISKSMHS